MSERTLPDVWFDPEDDRRETDPRPVAEKDTALVHMTEEYARHCGQADVRRECVDARTGL